MSGSRAGGVRKQLVSQSFIDWLMPHFDERSLEGIANNVENREKQMQILNEVFERADLPPSFTEDLYEHEKNILIDRLEMKIMSDNPHLADRRSKEKMGFSRRERYSEDHVESSIKSPSKEPKKKASRRRWTPREEAVLRSSKDEFKTGKINLSDIQNKINKVGGERSKDAIRKKLKRMMA